MRAHGATESIDPARTEDTEFSLALGGPMYQLLLGSRLARPPLGLVHRRLLFAIVITWLPLLVLSLVEGHAFAGVPVPFLHDVEAYARFLVAVPLLVLAEPLVHQQLRHVVHEFTENGLVPEEAMPRFRAAVVASMRLRNSTLAEIALVVLVYAFGPWTWEHGLALPLDTWSMIDGAETAAGYWYLYVSAPIFQFLLLRWLFRLAIWWVFLWRVARLPLALQPLHPDRAGGIGFLGLSLSALLPIMIAQGVVVAGLIFSRVTFGGDTVEEYHGMIAAMVGFLVLLSIGPLLFFAKPLTVARRDALMRFGVFATRYAREFERKWMGGAHPVDEVLLGNPDIQSMTDLGGTHEILHAMRAVPFDLRAFGKQVAGIALPFLPLVLTVVPVFDLVKALAVMVL